MIDRTIQEARDEGFDQAGIDPCDTCEYNSLDWHEEPCESCTGEDNHWKPSASPTQTNTFKALEALDCISRAAAIEVADAIWSVTGDKNVAKVWDQLKDLPSAQPERTCVNCGRTMNNGGWYADGGTRCPIEEHYALPKDGFCHLWEKRNVTDDDYTERREE